VRRRLRGHGAKDGAAHTHLAHALRAGLRDQCGKDALGRFRAFDDRCERRAAWRTQTNQVGRFTGREIAGFVRPPQRFGARAGREIEQVRRRERHALWNQPLQHVALKRLLYHAEADARADVGSQRETDARGEMPPHGEDASPQRGVAARAMRNGRACFGQARQFEIAGEHVMREYGSWAGKSEAVVNRQITFRPRKRRAYGGDFLHALVHVRLKQHAGMLTHERAAHLEHPFRRRKRETGRDGVELPIAAVIARDQTATDAIGIIGRLAQRGRQRSRGAPARGRIHSRRRPHRRDRSCAPLRAGREAATNRARASRDRR
jgi:hypothetical protein